MFESFFPKPKLFLGSLVIWTAIVMAIYCTIGQTLGESVGFTFTEEGAPPVIGLGYFVTPEFLWFDLFYFIFWQRQFSLFFGRFIRRINGKTGQF